MGRGLLSVLIFAVMIMGMKAQTGCCAPSATHEFAALGAGAEFRSVHLEPRASQEGDMGGERQEIRVDGGAPTQVHLFRAAGTPQATIIVIHEWWGMNDHVIATAQQLHEDLGKKVDVVVVDLYDGIIATTREAASMAMQNADEERITDILSAVIGGARSPNIGTIGWCFGGGWSLQTALLAGSKAKACVMYYGMPEKSVDRLKQLQAPVLGIFASKDKWISPQVVEAFQANMMSAEKSLTVKVYTADHAFANPSNPHFDDSSARDAWENTLDFFSLHLLR